jgi:hypothetical protein
LVIGSKAREGYTIDTANDAIQVLDIAGETKGRTIKPSTPQTPFSQPSAVALVSSTASEMLAVVSQNNKQLYLVGLNPDMVVGSVPLDHTPVAVTVSPGGQWAYVLEQETAGSFVQAVNLHRIQLKLPPIVGTPFKVGDASLQIVVSDTGAHLYIPFTDDVTKPVVGGVAVLDMSEQACEEILWRHLDGCPQCNTPNCVVVATIEHYKAGDKVEDQTDPPADPAKDIAAGITRIDNRKGRQLLPSIQVLKELIECLMQQGPGGTGTPGPPGRSGADGKNGAKGDPGIDKVNLELPPCGKPGSANIVTDAAGKRTLELVIPTGCDTDLPHICAISWVHPKPPLDDKANFTPLANLEKGVLVAFDRPVLNGDIHRHSFMVLAKHRDEQSNTDCWCELHAERVGGIHLPKNCEISEDFEPEVNPDKPVNGAQLLLPLKAFTAKNEYRVVLKGDFIRDAENKKGIDADHLPPWLPKRPSGDGTEGGTFESWFMTGEG